MTFRHIHSIIRLGKSGKKFLLLWVDSHGVTQNLKQGGSIKRYISFRLLMVSNYASWGESLNKGGMCLP